MKKLVILLAAAALSCGTANGQELANFARLLFK